MVPPVAGRPVSTSRVFQRTERSHGWWGLNGGAQGETGSEVADGLAIEPAGFDGLRV